MKEHCGEFPIEKMAKVLNVSRAGYYRYINKKETLTMKKNRELTKKIKSIFETNRATYGSPRIHAILKKQGEHCSRKRIAKIMKQNQIQAKTRKRWKPAAKASRDSSKIAPNLLEQNFATARENIVWVLDITYVETQEGWLYVSTVLDLYSRRIVGLSMGSRMGADLVIRSLNQAIQHRSPEAGLILHSDRGIQYTSSDYQKLAQENGFVLSMSAKGRCYDNAAMESFFHTLKTEHIFFQKFVTREDAMQSIFEYIEVFYNRQRVHSTLNFVSPLEFEQQASVFRESRMKLALPAIEAKI